MNEDAPDGTRRRSTFGLELVRHRPVVLCVCGYLVAWLVFGIVARRSNTVMYVGTIAVLIVIFTWIDVEVGLPARLLWALAVLGFLHLMGGLVPLSGGRILYNLPLPPHPLALDRLVHAYGAAVVAFVAWEVLRHDLAPHNTPPWSALCIVGLAAMGIAALEEVAEFVSTRLWVTQVGGYVNTGWDLVFDLFGSVAVVLWLRRHASTPIGSQIPPRA